MNDTPDTTSSGTNAPPARKPLSNKRWIFFAFFFLFAVSMYAGTWYRITTAGFMGTGKPLVAQPNAKAPQASQPQVATPK